MADPRTLAPFPLGWNDSQEKDFQTYMAFDPNVRKWRNGFQTKYGEMPDEQDNKSFNYRAAYASGDAGRPQPYAGDTMSHWGSAGKMPNHPTEWMQQFWDRFGGADPNLLPAVQWTAPMQQFMQKQLQEVPFETTPRGLF